MINVKNKIIEKLKEADPELDLSEGSNFRDLLVDPLTPLLEQYEQDLESVKNLVNGVDITNLTREELDALASNFLIERNEGTQATGGVIFRFAQPTSVNIPAGTKLINNDLEFKTVGDVYVSKLQMESNLTASGTYPSPEISIIAQKKGTDSMLEEGAQLELSGSLSTDPSSILVSTALTGGTADESNAQFAERIKTSLYSNSLASPDVISLRVMEQSSSVNEAIVVGADSPHMLRDLTPKTATGDSLGLNYAYVYSGQQYDPYTKGHVAFIEHVKASGVNGLVSWPEDPSAWTQEVTDSFYKSISKLEDGLTATQNQYQIISYDSFAGRTLRTEFNVHDGFNLDNSLIWEDEIRIDGNAVVLGKTFTQNEKPPIKIGLDDVESWSKDLQEGSDEGNIQTIKEVQDQIAKYTTADTYSNTAPILHKEINQHLGVTIDFTSLTTDGTEEGEIAYATLLRNSKIYAPHDGYGLAWKKQSEWLIRINNNTYTDEDIDRFIDVHGVNPIDEGLVGNLSNSANDKYWDYNIYLVDNDILQKEGYQGLDQILDQTGGINQFLQSGKFWIEPNITYDFKLKIWETLATKIWVKPTTVSEFTQSEHLIIDRGTTYPNYVPNAGEKIVTGDSEVDVLDSTKGHFGIGVGETKGWEWRVSSVHIRSFIQTFPQQLFKFNVDVDKWGGASSPFEVNWWGYGYDGNYPSNGKAQLAIWNPQTGNELWESVGTNLAEPSSAIEDKKITRRFTSLGDYTVTEGGNTYIYIAASAANLGDGFEGHVDHNLVSHYVEISNPEEDSYHRGNAIDVYCRAPSEVVESGSEYIVDSQTGEIIITDSFLQDIIEIRETISQIAIPNNEWTLFNMNRGETFGPSPKLKIAFDGNWKGASVTVIIRKWVTGDQIHTYLNSDSVRYPATTAQAKVMPPALLSIDRLDYSGVPEEDEVKALIKEWVNELGLTFEKSDLIAFLYENNIDFVSLDMDVSVRQYTSQFTWTDYTITSQRYTIPDTVISRFYTDANLLAGVSRV